MADVKISDLDAASSVVATTLFETENVTGPASEKSTGAQILAYIISAFTAATESVAGKVELATAAETLTGTDDTRAVHPKGLKDNAILPGLPQNSKSAAYTLVLADANSHIYHPDADTTARIWTIPANSSVAYPIGTTLTFVNGHGAGVITIAITSDTMRLSPGGTTGSRTLAANGMATAIKVGTTEWKISGSGLT